MHNCCHENSLIQVLEDTEIVCMDRSLDTCSSWTLRPVLLSAPGCSDLALKYDLGQGLKSMILS